jgi:hypothetical protein
MANKAVYGKDVFLTLVSTAASLSDVTFSHSQVMLYMLGILGLNHPRYVEETRGFSWRDAFCPGIVLRYHPANVVEGGFKRGQECL